MKLLDKLKNALFEEEYVEIEEKPKKVKPDKVKKDTYIKEDKSTVEDKPIAKRIVPQEKKRDEEHHQERVKEEPIRDHELNKPKEEPKFTIVTDEDLRSDDEQYTEHIVIESQPKKRRSNIDKQEEISQIETPVVKETKLYQASKSESYLENYTPHEYGKYEKQKEKEIFKPSPIISPIYGIVSENSSLDKEQRPEIRLTTSISHDKMNLDEVRKKAFGDLTDDISNNVGLKQEVIEEPKESSNLLLDLSDGKTTPEVSSITMGDAEEYFEDLGLEYNKDYIDSSKTTRVEKNANLDSPRGEALVEEEDNNSNTIIIKEKTETEDDNKETPVSDKDDANLFDLIDSMYEE